MSAEIKPGYKQTELGMIPEDWDVRPLGQLVHSVEYGSSAKSSSTGKIPVLRMGNIQEGKIDWSDLVFTDNENEITKYLLNPGDVLFNRTNTVDLVGKTAIYKGGRPSIFAGYLIRIKEKKDQIDSRYLNYFLNSEPAKNYGQKVLSVAVGQANINGQKLKTYPIALPPTVDEQNSIATAVSEMEELISHQNQLITKKRDIQLAAMQQLLTGKRRLPGFSGEWKVKRLGDLASLNRINVTPFSTPDKAFTHFSLPAFDEGKRPVKESGATIGSNKFAVPAGAVLVSKLNPRIPRVWLPKNIPANSVASTEFLVLTPRDGVVREFLYVACKSSSFCAQMELSATGTTGSHQRISPTSTLGILVNVPSDNSEQTAIAAVLSDMDTELAALEAYRDKARQLKQGMIQELLTGRIRLA
ncbi:type I restriction enzyme, S subunit [Pseudomonas mohnii]|uniref:Type I restriction enzyme, S subunit n=1 Tax=Pseudomonas mohnii TaxID=395600 RepID=A0ABY0Y152_9PSED|nr:restriction endonuclease subunit S [Pseudomonas mohnii]SEC73612.1 type I restriction enzyme, S subunit [Pseudomonas mohnii]